MLVIPNQKEAYIVHHWLWFQPLSTVGSVTAGVSLLHEHEPSASGLHEYELRCEQEGLAVSEVWPYIHFYTSTRTADNLKGKQLDGRSLWRSHGYRTPWLSALCKHLHRHKFSANAWMLALEGSRILSLIIADRQLLKTETWSHCNRGLRQTLHPHTFQMDMLTKTFGGSGGDNALMETKFPGFITPRR